MSSCACWGTASCSATTRPRSSAARLTTTSRRRPTPAPPTGWRCPLLGIAAGAEPSRRKVRDIRPAHVTTGDPVQHGGPDHSFVAGDGVPREGGAGGDERLSRGADPGGPIRALHLHRAGPGGDRAGARAGDLATWRAAGLSIFSGQDRGCLGLYFPYAAARFSPRRRPLVRRPPGRSD